MKVAYIAHPISGSIDHLTHLIKVIRTINLTYPGVIPFCPYYADVMALDDSIPDQRACGMSNTEVLFRRKFIDEVWLTGDKISEGMYQEIALARMNNIPVLYKLHEF